MVRIIIDDADDHHQYYDENDDCSGAVEEIRVWAVDETRGGVERQKHLQTLGDHSEHSGDDGPC